MAKFTSTNAQYYLVLGLLQEASTYSLTRCLERDLLALVDPAPITRWGTSKDVHHLAGLVIRTFEKAGISVVDSLGEEGDYNHSVDQTQVVKDLFALNSAIRDFLNVTWGSDGAQQQEIQTLVSKTLVAAGHSRMVLRSVHHKKALVEVTR